jgi:hypothetical protein
MTKTVENTLVISILGAVTVPAHAKTPGIGAGASCAAITIRVWDPLPVEAGTLRRAKTVVERVFHRSGVRIVWVDCAVDGPPSCSTPGGPDEISLRIFRRSKEVRRATGNSTGGAALIGGGVGIVQVFVDRLEEISDGERVPLGLALGITATHEIGHLLIGRGHSPLGIMRGTLEGMDWHSAAQGSLLFTRQEAAFLRSGVCERPIRP